MAKTTNAADEAKKTNSINDNSTNLFSKILKWIKTHVGITLIIVGALLLALIIADPIKSHSDSFWGNFWTSAPVILTGLIALISVYYQLQKDEDARQHERFLQIQDSLQTDLIPRISGFSKELRQGKSTEDLVTDLVILMNSTHNIDDYRKSLKDSDDSEEYADMSEEFSDRVEAIVKDDANKEIVDIVENSYSELAARINQMKEHKEDQAPVAGVINDIDERILGSWFINYDSAKKAKFLIGVSTYDKRIVGAYHLNQQLDQSDEDRRIHFNLKPEDRIYLENLNSNTRPWKGPMPRLDKWTARNPVLYYKSFLEVKNYHLSDDEQREITSFLGITTGEYDKLEARDIVVVRTYKFDQ